MTPERQSRFQRNPDLERLLKELNARLPLAEQDVCERHPAPKLPVVLVVGAPRSGTTLMMQWLAQSGRFAYPTNLLSRFFGAPYVGALICQLIGDPQYNFGNELRDHSLGARPFSSELGKTSGMFEPNEFWSFWRRFIPNDQAEKLSDEDLQRVDVRGFLSGLAALQAAYNLPWAMKGIILQYNLKFLAAILEKVLFVHIKRDLIDNARSLLKAREQYYGSTKTWFSVRPPAYAQLLSGSPEEQVVGQVHLTNASIEKESKTIAKSRFLSVDYQAFCRNPEEVYHAIQERLQDQAYLLPTDYCGAKQFDAQSYSVKDSMSNEIESAVSKILHSVPGL